MSSTTLDTIDELPVRHPYVHRQGPGRRAARAAAAAARRSPRYLFSGGDDDAAACQTDSSTADRTPRRALAATGPGGGLLLPFELEFQVIRYIYLLAVSLRPFIVRLNDERIRMYILYVISTLERSKCLFFFSTKIAPNRRCDIKNARTKVRCRFMTLFSLFRRIVNESLRWSPFCETKTSVLEDSVCRRWYE